MTRKQRRAVLIVCGLLVLGGATGLVLSALESKVSYFYSPSDVVAQSVGPGERFRLGGLVKEGSIAHGDGTAVGFVVTDTNKTLEVRYSGILPDLFREGQGVVTEGSLDTTGVFVADSVLARHDENYMPKEVADALKRQGVWQETDAKSQSPSQTQAEPSAAE